MSVRTVKNVKTILVYRRALTGLCDLKTSQIRPAEHGNSEEKQETQR